MIQGEFSNDGELHIGISPEKNIGTNGNWYGIYLGPNNPCIEEKYSYAVPPIDDLDYAAFLHDKGYDKKRAAGAMDAVLNYRVLNEDIDLISKSFQTKSQGSMRKYIMSKLTGIVFLFISPLKAQTEYILNNTQ